jgi:hypothetical protein
MIRRCYRLITPHGRSYNFHTGCMYNLAMREGRVRDYGTLQLGYHYTITYIWKYYPFRFYYLRLQPRDIWIYTPQDFDFTSQEISLTNEGWFELEFVFTGWLNNVPCMESIRTNTGVCPR